MKSKVKYWENRLMVTWDAYAKELLRIEEKYSPKDRASYRAKAEAKHRYLSQAEAITNKLRDAYQSL